jgi:hypothetical protein
MSVFTRQRGRMRLVLHLGTGSCYAHDRWHILGRSLTLPAPR